MKVGARNQLKARVTAIKRGDVMAQVKFVVPAESVMGSVITAESLDELDLEVADEVEVSNMYTIAETLLRAAKVVSL